MFNAMERFFLLRPILCSCNSSVTDQLSDFFSLEPLLCKITIENGHRFALDVFTKIWCNYTGILLTLCKMMRNELLMKTLPGAAQ